MFDAKAILDMTIEGANSTEFVQIPGGEYTGSVKDLKVRQQQSKDQQETFTLLDIFWSVADPSGKIKAETGRDENVAKQTIFLDISESGGLKMGKGENVQLGIVRDALDLNNPNEAFTFNQMKGRSASIKIENDGQYSNVTKVAKVA